MKILYPWKMVGRYADDKEIEVGDFNEEDYTIRLISMIDKHGDPVQHFGISNEDYVAGEYIGRENSIHDQLNITMKDAGKTGVFFLHFGK